MYGEAKLNPKVHLKINGKDTSPVIRQKDESQNWCFNKAKHAKIFEKQTFLTS